MYITGYRHPTPPALVVVMGYRHHHHLLPTPPALVVVSRDPWVHNQSQREQVEAPLGLQLIDHRHIINRSPNGAIPWYYKPLFDILSCNCPPPPPPPPPPNPQNNHKKIKNLSPNSDIPFVLKTHFFYFFRNHPPPPPHRPQVYTNTHLNSVHGLPSCMQ